LPIAIGSRDQIPLGADLSLITQMNLAAEFAVRGVASGGGGAAATTAERFSSKPQLLVETDDAKTLAGKLQKEGYEDAIAITDNFVSCALPVMRIKKLIEDDVGYLHSCPQAFPQMERASVDLGLRTASGSRREIAQTGKGVLIGIVDTGFDLTHPAFLDARKEIRVEALLDQTTGREYTQNELNKAKSWPTPGNDLEGHGTHVAAIAGGSEWNGCEGIAPGCTFLLVKADPLKVSEAVHWIVTKAKNRPCVVNLSLGYHAGPHDGSNPLERILDALSGPNRIFVVAAGNDRDSRAHIRGDFHLEQQETFFFDIEPASGRGPRCQINAWHHPKDVFEAVLITPSKERIAFPPVGYRSERKTKPLTVVTARRRWGWTDCVQVHTEIIFTDEVKSPSEISAWGIEFRCRQPHVGRLDVWIDKLAGFRNHPMLDQHGTIMIPATSRSCIAVASYGTKSQWESDDGTQISSKCVVGRSSPFSSMGPTRDGRAKPDIAAPGEYITSALATGCNAATWRPRAWGGEQRLLTLEGTSMSAPIVAGVVALLMEKSKNLDPEKVRDALIKGASHDVYTGEDWDPAYGHGKINAEKALKYV
jgi:subtilisin family serine protease